jgi:hypothetical protein
MMNNEPLNLIPVKIAAMPKPICKNSPKFWFGDRIYAKPNPGFYFDGGWCTVIGVNFVDKKWQYKVEPDQKDVAFSGFWNRFFIDGEFKIIPAS